jgi:hypothetical protein
MDGHESAAATPARREAADPSPVIPLQRMESTGLRQRIPGANLASGLRDRSPRPRPVEVRRPAVQRDPDADRAAFDAFSSGLAQATLAWDTAIPSPGPRHGRLGPAGDSTEGSD